MDRTQKESETWADRDHDVPNHMDTKFNLGSMNKMFTAVAVLQLVEQGKLTLDDRIIDHLVYYPNQDIAAQVTIHQLLTHTSGLGDFFSDEFMDSRKDRFRTLDDHLPLFVDQPLPATSTFSPPGAALPAGAIRRRGICSVSATACSITNSSALNARKQCWRAR